MFEEADWAQLKAEMSIVAWWITDAQWQHLGAATEAQWQARIIA